MNFNLISLKHHFLSTNFRYDYLIIIQYPISFILNHSILIELIIFLNLFYSIFLHVNFVTFEFISLINPTLVIDFVFLPQLMNSLPSFFLFVINVLVLIDETHDAFNQAIR